MPERINTVSTWVAVATAGTFSGLVQIFMLTLLAWKMRPVQYVAAFGLSTIVGGGLAAIALDKGISVWIAGPFAAFMGALPSILIPFIVARYVLKRVGMTPDDLTQMLNMVAGVQHGIEGDQVTTSNTKADDADRESGKGATG